MGSTAVGNGSVDTRFMTERLVSTLSELHEVLVDYYDQVPSHAFFLIENMLNEYNDVYGRGAKRVKHIKHPNGVFTIDPNS